MVKDQNDKWTNLITKMYKIDKIDNLILIDKMVLLLKIFLFGGKEIQI